MTVHSTIHHLLPFYVLKYSFILQDPMENKVIYMNTASFHYLIF
jgi:hypothetical protein